jgi:hypothetical protein
MSSTITKEIKTHNASVSIESVDKQYDADTDCLFLVYYALPDGFNSNKWGVSYRSLRTNIKTAIGKPVVLYRKNPNNPFHTKQAGNWVHPTPEEAMAELRRPIGEQEYYQWQSRFAVGKVRDVEERARGFAWTLEITDPGVKNAIKSDSFDKPAKGTPAWTSPQIFTFPGKYPDEDRTEIYDHWTISHVALVDIPAYGFERAATAAKCVGAEQECLVKTKSASIVGPKYAWGYLDPRLDEEIEDLHRRTTRLMSRTNKVLAKYGLDSEDKVKPEIKSKSASEEAQSEAEGEADSSSGSGTASDFIKTMKEMERNSAEIRAGIERIKQMDKAFERIEYDRYMAMPFGEFIKIPPCNLPGTEEGRKALVRDRWNLQAKEELEAMKKRQYEHSEEYRISKMSPVEKQLHFQERIIPHDRGNTISDMDFIIPQDKEEQAKVLREALNKQSKRYNPFTGKWE